MRRKDVTEAIRRLGAPPIRSDGPTAVVLTLSDGKRLYIAEREGVYLVRTGRTPFCRRYRIPQTEVLVK